MTQAPTGPPDARGRPTRADARRNYSRLLQAAAAAFAHQGADASLNDIARHAGVGAATLYRHFPTRETLLEALLADRHQTLTTQAQRLSDSPAPADALLTWLRAFSAHVSTYRGLAALVRAGLHDEQSAFYASCQDMTGAGEQLLTRAQRSQQVRPDITITEVLKLVNAIAIATERAPAEADRLLSLAMDGLRHRQPTGVDRQTPCATTRHARP